VDTMFNTLEISPLSSLEFTALDLETTNLDPHFAEILEIGAIRFNKNQILSEFSSLVKPQKPIPSSATAINGITADVVRNAPLLEDILVDFVKFIEGSILVIQNSNFDLSFLLYYSKKLGIPFPDLPVFCTLQLSRKVFPKFGKYNLIALRKNLSIPDRRQGRSEIKNIHEALDDSFAAMEVFKRCLEARDSWELPFSKVIHHEKGQKFVRDYGIK